MIHNVGILMVVFLTVIALVASFLVSTVVASKAWKAINGYFHPRTIDSPAIVPFVIAILAAIVSITAVGTLIAHMIIVALISYNGLLQ